MSSKKSPMEITIESYDQTATEYAENIKSFFPKYIEKFFEYLKPNSYILDLGCGSGKDANLFTERGHRVMGIDLSKELIKIARKTVPQAEFKVMDIMDLKFKPETFDGIWSIASLLHVPKEYMQSTLQGCYEVLKEDGILYVSVKRGYGEGMKSDEKYGGVQKYWSFFQQDEIEKFLKGQGFKIIEVLSEIKEDSYATNPWVDIICRK